MKFLQVALLAASAVLTAAEDGKETIFNGVKVPPFMQLGQANFKSELAKSKFVMVKHFSPYCPHCMDFAPTFQTTYEYYYTSKPGADGKGTKSFTDYYDFRFAALDCTIYGDLCDENEVKRYPTTIIYMDGKPVQTIAGGKDMDGLSVAIEESIQMAMPGSRPKKLALPKAGDSVAPKPPPKAYNEDGVSISLTADNFEDHVTKTSEPWFIKFYAPWCSHCQAMAPTWQQLAKKMAGKLNIGEVNCDKEKRLCKQVGATAFPTILFFNGEERAEYQGLRGLGDFADFATSAVELAGGIPEVTASTLTEMEKKDEVIFVYFYDHATTTEDFKAIEKLPLSLAGHAKLVKSNDPELFKRFEITTWPRLMVTRDGHPSYYPPIAPHEMRDSNRVLEWMKSVWLPLIPELTASNARQIMDNKIVALAILNRKEEEAFNGYMRELKTAVSEWMESTVQEKQLKRKKMRDAKQMRIEEAEDRGDEKAIERAKNIRINMNKPGHKEVAFAWVDGVFWQRWIRTTYGVDVKEGERIIINDQSARRYWDQTITGSYIRVSRTAILETLDKVVFSTGTLKPKFTISAFEKFFFDIKVAFVEHTYLALFATGCILFAAYSWLRSRTRRRGGHFRLDDGVGIRDLKDGLLGHPAASNHKAD